MEAVLAEDVFGLNASTSRAPIMPDTVFINMTAPGIDKASGVAAVAKAYGIPLEHVMMVGDSGNDVPVMRMVGYPVAMGNSSPKCSLRRGCASVTWMKRAWSRRSSLP